LEFGVCGFVWFWNLEYVWISNFVTKDKRPKKY
jgi:hypothetical protein